MNLLFLEHVEKQRFATLAVKFFSKSEQNFSTQKLGLKG
jgi:hypothetical protein